MALYRRAHATGFITLIEQLQNSDVSSPSNVCVEDSDGTIEAAGAIDNGAYSYYLSLLMGRDIVLHQVHVEYTTTTPY